MSNITVTQWRKSLRQETHCVYCDRGFDDTGGVYLVIEHIIPRAYGGQDVPENLVAACSKCNGSKSDKDLYEWAFEQLDSGSIPPGVISRIASCINRNINKFKDDEKERRLQEEYDRRHPPGTICARGEDGSNRIPEDVKQQILKKAIHSFDYENIGAGYHNFTGRLLSAGSVRRILNENFKLAQEYMVHELTENAEIVIGYWREHPEEMERIRVLTDELSARYEGLA